MFLDHHSLQDTLAMTCNLSMLASYGIHTFRKTWTVLNEFSERLPVGSLIHMTESLVCHVWWENYNGKHCRSVAEFNVCHLCTSFSMVRWRCQASRIDWLGTIYVVLRTSRGDYNQQKLYKPRTHTTEYQKSFVHRTIPEWNSLPSSVAQSDTVSTFKCRLSALP